MNSGDAMNVKTNGKAGMKEAMSDEPKLMHGKPQGGVAGLEGGISKATKYLNESLNSAHHMVDNGKVSPQ